MQKAEFPSFMHNFDAYMTYMIQYCIIIFVQQLFLVHVVLRAPLISILVAHLHHLHHQDRRPCTTCRTMVDLHFYLPALCPELTP